jgi:hypothetical protein
MAVIGLSATLAVTAALLSAQTLPGTLPGVEPLHESGQDVTPSFEGWFKNADGSFELLFGYHNRNTRQELDIPIGPNNRIEPGGPDQGQPTHFMPRRGTGVFTIRVPKDFGTKKITWTLVSAGKTNAIPGSLDSRWEMDALNEVTSGNTPPVIRFGPAAPANQGPRTFYGPSLTGAVGQPVSLEAWSTDDAKNRSRNYRGAPVTVTWSKYRGPGGVTFEKNKPAIDAANGGRSATTAIFKAPGDYVLRLVANDSSGDGGQGFGCCWTNGLVKVMVKP